MKNPPSYVEKNRRNKEEIADGDSVIFMTVLLK
jgi:hypothetical protein